MPRKKRIQWGQTVVGLQMEQQKSLYLFVTVLLMMGVIFGAILVNVLDHSQKEGLLNYLGYFFQELKQNQVADAEIVFQHALGDHLKTLGLLWLLGISVIGMPILLIILFLKGLVMGFTMGFFVNQLGWSGLWFALVSLVPQNLLIIPAMIIVAVMGMHFSLYLIKNRLLRYRGLLYPQFLNFSIVVIAMAGCFLLASVIEAYLSPLLMKQIVPEVAGRLIKALAQT